MEDETKNEKINGMLIKCGKYAIAFFIVSSAFIAGITSAIGFGFSMYNNSDKFLIKPSTKLKYSEDDGWGHFDVIVNNFLASYEENKGKICSNNNPSEEDNPCDFDVNSLGACNKAGYEEFERGKPCIYLTLNNNIEFNLQPFNKTKLPADMPENLKKHIQEISTEDLKQVFVECHGKNISVFQEQIEELEYYPQTLGKVNFSGFPFYYFTFKNEDAFENPIVAIRIEKKQSPVNKFEPIKGEVEIECIAWANNIDDDKDFIVADIIVDF